MHQGIDSQMARLGRKARERKASAMAHATPINHAQYMPVIGADKLGRLRIVTSASNIQSPMCDLAGAIQRPGFRFHDPLGGVLRAKNPTAPRFIDTTLTDGEVSNLRPIFGFVSPRKRHKRFAKG